MRPEDIRKLYQEEQPATDEEARATEQEAMTDPEEARRFLATMYAVAGEDPAFTTLLSEFMQVMLALDIKERAEADDAYALKCAQQAINLMHLMRKEPPKRTPRGKPKQARSA